MRFKSIDINPYLPGNLESFIASSLKNYMSINSEYFKEILHFKHYGNTSGYLLFNIPIDQDTLIPTPHEHSDVINKENFISESILATFGSVIGHIFGYKEESNGFIFNNIRPRKENSFQQSSESSGVFLELHKEIAFHDISPDFLLLYCLRGDREHKALTGISSIRKSIKNLQESTINELAKKNFKIGVDYSFSSSKGIGKEKIISVLQGPKDDPYMVYDADLITPLNDKAAESLSLLDAELRKNMEWLDLQSGDLIVIDNNRTVHSRTSYSPYYDGKDRWLQRAFVKNSRVEAEKIINKKLIIIDEL